MRSLLAVCLVISLAAANPGLQASLELSDLNQVLMIAYAFGLTQAEFDLGDYALNYASPFGSIDAHLSNIVVGDFSVDYSTSIFEFQSPNFATYSIYNLSLSVSAGYNFIVTGVQLPPGNGTLTVTDTNITANLTMLTVNGQPQLVLNSYIFELGPISLETSLPSYYNDIIQKVITVEEPTISALIPSLLHQYLPLVNVALAGLNLNIAVPGTNVAVNLGLSSNPEIINDDQLLVGLAGTVTQGGKPVNGGNAVPIPSQGVLSEGVQIGISDTLINAVLISLWPDFNYNLESMPEWLSEDLKTDHFVDALPSLVETFGLGLPVSINVRAGGPIAFGTNGKVNVEAHVLLDIKVKTGLFHWTLAATFAAKVDAVVIASVTNNVAHAHIKELALPSLSIVHNFIGTIVLDIFRPIVDIVKDIVIKKVNDKIKSVPIPLPMGLGSFIQTDDIVVKTGYILAGLDL